MKSGGIKLYFNTTTNRNRFIERHDNAFFCLTDLFCDKGGRTSESEHLVAVPVFLNNVRGVVIESDVKIKNRQIEVGKISYAIGISRRVNGRRIKYRKILEIAETHQIAIVRLTRSRDIIGAYDDFHLRLADDLALTPLQCIAKRPAPVQKSRNDESVAGGIQLHFYSRRRSGRTRTAIRNQAYCDAGQIGQGVVGQQLCKGNGRLTGTGAGQHDQRRIVGHGHEGAQAVCRAAKSCSKRFFRVGNCRKRIKKSNGQLKNASNAAHGEEGSGASKSNFRVNAGKINKAFHGKKIVR